MGSSPSRIHQHIFCRLDAKLSNVRSCCQYKIFFHLITGSYSLVSDSSSRDVGSLQSRQPVMRRLDGLSSWTAVLKVSFGKSVAHSLTAYMPNWSGSYVARAPCTSLSNLIDTSHLTASCCVNKGSASSLYRDKTCKQFFIFFLVQYTCSTNDVW